jgi:hypothetical protein
MHNSRVAIICYAAAVGFILAVAFHSPAKLLITADVPAAASSTKWIAGMVEIGLKAKKS